MFLRAHLYVTLAAEGSWERSAPSVVKFRKSLQKGAPIAATTLSARRRLPNIEPFSAKASLLATLFLRMRLIPQEIFLTPEKIVIQTWGFFWLSRSDEDIPWEKIAGYHYHAGWFWDSLEIQTRGQTANRIRCLQKPDGLRIKEILEQMKE